jgi:hypothetical protein
LNISKKIQNSTTTNKKQTTLYFLNKRIRVAD